MISDGTIFIIDSSKRIPDPNSTDANFSYIINIPKQKQYTHAVILQSIIPKSYYLVQVPNNTFILSENGTQTTITIQPGNYNVKSWQALIPTILTNSSTQGWTYTISFPSTLTQVDTGLFTFTCTGGTGTQPQFIFPSTSNLYEQFGFAPNSTNIFSSNTLVSTAAVKFQNEDVLYLHSDICYNNDQSATCDVLQEIYASSSPNWTNIIYQNQGSVEAYSKILLNPNNNIYKFKLTDENNNIINLNGKNQVHTLFVYKKAVTPRLIEQIDDYTRMSILKSQ